jgi:hypothetical protein
MLATSGELNAALWTSYPIEEDATGQVAAAGGAARSIYLRGARSPFRSNDF